MLAVQGLLQLRSNKPANPAQGLKACVCHAGGAAAAFPQAADPAQRLEACVCHAGGAAAAFPQAADPAQRSEVPQHAGGPPLEGQGHRLQPEQDGQDRVDQCFSHLHACQQPTLAGPRGNKHSDHSNNNNNTTNSINNNA